MQNKVAEEYKKHSIFVMEVLRGLNQYLSPTVLGVRDRLSREELTI